MFVQTDTISFVDRIEAELLHPPVKKAVLALGRKRRERYRVINDFQGPIQGQAYSLDGKWRYLPMCEEDKKIIPKSAFIRHEAVEKHCCKVVQVVIGHEIPEFSPAPSRPEEKAPAFPVVPANPKPEIDWSNVAEVAGKGLVIGVMGVAMVSLFALWGAFQLIDPSYCVVLDDGFGTVVELLTWHLEAPHEVNS